MIDLSARIAMDIPCPLSHCSVKAKKKLLLFHLRHDHVPSTSYTCKLKPCHYTYSSIRSYEKHLQRDHPDILSPWYAHRKMNGNYLVTFNDSKKLVQCENYEVYEKIKAAFNVTSTIVLLQWNSDFEEWIYVDDVKNLPNKAKLSFKVVDEVHTCLTTPLSSDDSRSQIESASSTSSASKALSYDEEPVMTEDVPQNSSDLNLYKSI